MSAQRQQWVEQAQRHQQVRGLEVDMWSVYGYLRGKEKMLMMSTEAEQEYVDAKSHATEVGTDK